MLNSNNQLTRILTIALVLGAVLFITLAQIAHFKSKDNAFSGETIYIQQEGDVLAQQEEGAITTQGSQIAEQPEEIISTEMEISQTEGDISNNNWAETSLENIGLEQVLDFEHISLLVTNMNTNEREKILSDQQLFKQVIENEANNRSAIIAAVNNQLNEHPNVKFMMKRNAENMLLEFYLNLLVKRKLPQEFPSNEEMIAYYESNKETQFTFPLRARIWQIFLSKPKDATEEETLAIQKRSEEIISKIEKGINDFTNIAVSQSEHEQSRNRGGYMGVLEVDGLLPEIKEYVLKSKIGEISDPIETDSGLHILKRGLILAEETLTFEQAEDQVRRILIQQSSMQLKNTIFEQARENYPQQISENKIEEWWLKLKEEAAP